MTDSIDLYPKTSCQTIEGCRQQYPNPIKGPRTNLCDFSPYYECYNTLLLNKQVQPVYKKGFQTLNLQVYDDKLDPLFDRVQCPCPIESCPKEVWMSRDPRQFDAMRAQTMPLDAIPINGKVKLKNIYDPKYATYGMGMRPYHAINDGQIMYYNDKSIEDAFYYPVFSEPAEESAIMFRDPMGSMKPEYNRKALINIENPVKRTACEYPDCLSFIQDTQSFREDLMALQQRKHNQEKWSALFASTFQNQ
jgi:hypothetical protein